MADSDVRKSRTCFFESFCFKLETVWDLRHVWISVKHTRMQALHPNENSKRQKAYGSSRYIRVFKMGPVRLRSLMASQGTALQHTSLKSRSAS